MAIPLLGASRSIAATDRGCARAHPRHRPRPAARRPGNRSSGLATSFEELALSPDTRVKTLAYGLTIDTSSHTTKRRTHSLFRQGCMLYELIPTMPEVRLLPLIERFTTLLAELPAFADTFGAI